LKRIYPSSSGFARLFFCVGEIAAADGVEMLMDAALTGVDQMHGHPVALSICKDAVFVFGSS
jgi:hypothetical protein